MADTSDTSLQAFGVITSALATYHDTDNDKYVEEVLRILTGKTRQDLAVIVLTLGTTAAGLLHIASDDKEDLTPETLLQRIALHITAKTYGEE